MKNSITLLALLFIVLYGSPAHAGKLMFGDDQRIVKLVDINLKGSGNEKLYLGYVVKTYFLGLGLYDSDGGYIIGVESNKDKYYPLPAPDAVEKMQQANLLPKDFPKYSLGVMDYLIGYSLYLAVASIFLPSFIRKKLKQNRI